MTLSKTLVEKMVARAQDEARRSDISELAAKSVSIDQIMVDVRAPIARMAPDQQDQVREYMEGINVEGPMKAMMMNATFGDGALAKGLFATAAAMAGGKLFGSMGGQSFAVADVEATPAPPPASEDQIDAAEAQLGFALPSDLRQFYAEVADGGVGIGEGIYSLAELISKHREMTAKPVGPQGQEWPSNLLPIQGDNWDLVSIDRDTGKLVFWDLEDLDDDEDLPADNPAWAKSFRHEADSLEQWLAQWDKAE